MEILTLNDGTVLNGHILENGDGLTIFIYLDNLPLATGFYLFNDESKTSHIVEENHGEINSYDGYTALTSINTEFGNCNITMRKGEK